MRMLSETCESISRLGARGGRTLSLLHQQLQSCQSGNASSRAVAEHLARTAAGPYFETLSRWVHRSEKLCTLKVFFVCFANNLIVTGG